MIYFFSSERSMKLKCLFFGLLINASCERTIDDNVSSITCIVTVTLQDEHDYMSNAIPGCDGYL